MLMFLRYIPAMTLSLLLFCSIPADGIANRSFGLFYQAFEADNITRDELSQLDEAGFEWIMTEEKLDEPTQELIREAGFSLYVLIPEYFAIPNRLFCSRCYYPERAASFLDHYQDNPTVRGIGMMAYSNWRNNSLPGQLLNITQSHRDDRIFFTLDSRPFSADQIAPLDGTALVTRNADALESQLEHNPVLSGIYYDPERPDLDIRDLQKVLDLLTSYRELPIFFDRTFFIANADRRVFPSRAGITEFATLSEITALYRHDPYARVANPPPGATGNGLDVSVIILFLLWAAFAAYYRLNPVYRKSLSRFFLNYVFFVNDVLMRRIRMPGDAAVLFVLSSFLAGLMALATAQLYLDTIAMGALLSFLPLIPSDWTHPVFFFWYFFILTAFCNALLIGWLRIANRRHSKTHQIATLFLWPQHINIPVITIGIILLRSFPSQIIVIFMFLIYWGIIFAGFFMTAYNMRRIQPTSMLYMASTYALFALLTTILISWLVIQIDLFAAWDLAASLAIYGS